MYVYKRLFLFATSYSSDVPSRHGEEARKLSSFEPVIEVKTSGSNLCNLKEMFLVSGGSFYDDIASESQQLLASHN